MPPFPSYPLDESHAFDGLDRLDCLNDLDNLDAADGLADPDIVCTTGQSLPIGQSSADRRDNFRIVARLVGSLTKTSGSLGSAIL